MTFGSKFLGAAAAAALMVTGSVAAAAPAQKLSLSQARVSSEAGESNEQFQGGFIIPVVIVVAVGLGLYFALDDSDS